MTQPSMATSSKAAFGGANPEPAKGGANPEPSADGYMLRMKDIRMRFGGVQALDGVSFDVKVGEIHGLIGENGAGKSTLMKILSGAYPFGEYAGQVMLGGEECSFRSVRDSEAKGICTVYQELSLVSCLNVCENLFMGHLLTKGLSVDWNEQYHQTSQVFKRIGLDCSPDTQVKALSIGRQQLVEIARSLIRNVKLLVLDEPTTALTNEEISTLFAILRELKQEGITIVFISHKLAEVFEVCDSITVLRDGKTIKSMDVSEADEREVIRLMVNREITQRFPEKTNVVGDEIAFEVKNWSVSAPEYAGRKVVDDASFFARKGEIVGISGLMGSGRTELATSVFGKAYGADIKGELFLEGRPISLSSPKQALHAGICYLTEDRKEKGLITIFDVKTNISLANMDQIIGGGILIDRNEETKVAEGFIDSLRIKTPTVEQTVANLSGGNQQKVVLAKSLNTHPKVLIVDEPTRGIDVGAKYEIHGILIDIAASGATVVMISSEMPELIGICDRIYVMHEGRIKGVFDRAEATQESIMALALSRG